MSETARIGEDGREWVECETCQVRTPRYYAETHAEIHTSPPVPSSEFSKPFRFGPEMPPGSVGGCCGQPAGCTISSRGCLHKVEKRAWQKEVGR